MFRKRSKDFRITVKNAGGGILCEALSGDFVFQEAGIIQSSIEFFRDPEPCEIHRGAVRARALGQLRMVCPMGQIVTVSTLDPLLRAMLPESAASIELTEVAP